MKVNSNDLNDRSNSDLSVKDNQSLKDTEFFTTAELAQKLKMNVQVITRKVKAGEIQAYKIGKDWRIPDQAVATWLESQTNQGRKKAFVKLKASPPAPMSEAKRTHLLEYILAQLEPQRDYSEAELKQLISRQSGNWEEICCELVAAGMVTRHGDQLKRNSEYDLLTPLV